MILICRLLPHQYEQFSDLLHISVLPKVDSVPQYYVFKYIRLSCGSTESQRVGKFSQQIMFAWTYNDPSRDFLASVFWLKIYKLSIVLTFDELTMTN